MKRRAHERKSASLPITIVDMPHLDNKLVTKDISDSGVFIIMNRSECPPVGRMLALRISGETWGEKKSTVAARVVRVTDEGIGLQFVDFEFN